MCTPHYVKWAAETLSRANRSGGAPQPFFFFWVPMSRFFWCILLVFLYLCVVLLSHQTLFHCADGKISRWRWGGGAAGGGWCVFLSILSGSGRSRGEGRFGRNAGGKALFSPHPALLFCLLFSVFYSSALRLGVSAPVRASCSLGEEKRFVCFRDCQQTSLGGNV